ncbi:MAG TPA: DUF1569 domain-containing protein [Burkholderiaceae bacterium]|jgi:hypothetical protein|nr:DUF1569 domain-containing protein [Burkholderiaceae bacterium]
MNTSTPDPTRRLVLKSGAAAACVAVAGCSGSHPQDRQLVFATLADALAELARLTQAVAFNPGATWTWSKTLLHCAQSIDYSMTGYPEAKSALFQHTAGAAAFSYFSSRGRMSHNLLEAIPGAATLDANAATAHALAALRTSIDNFQKFTGPLRPHFAYGALNRIEYEKAHAMHIANHLSAFTQAA